MMLALTGFLGMQPAQAQSVTLVKSGPPTVLTNGNLVYTFTLSNSSATPTSATTLIVQDLLPSGVNFVSAAAGTNVSSVTCTGTAPLSCSVGLTAALASGTAPTASFTVTTTAPATAGTISNYAATNGYGNGLPPPAAPGASCVSVPPQTVTLDWDTQSDPVGSPLPAPRAFPVGARTATFGFANLVSSTTPALELSNAYTASYPNVAPVPFAYGSGRTLRTNPSPASIAPYEVVLTFSSEVSNLRFTMFDLDGSVNMTLGATNAANAAQVIGVETLGGPPNTLVVVTGGTNNTTAPNFVGGSGGWAAGVSSRRPALNVRIPGTVREVTFRINTWNVGDPDMYFSDLIFDDLSTSCATATTTVQAPSADLSITKTNTPGSGPIDQPGDTLVSGSTVNYQIVVRNLGANAADGAVIHDAATTGLSCITNPTCTFTGGATCPTSLAIASLQGTGGLIIPTLPAGGTVTLSLSCQVTATGQ